MKVSVFVPAVMSVGLLFSIASLLSDLFRVRSRQARERRAEIEAQVVARTTIDPSDRSASMEVGSANRTSYLTWAMGLLVVACYIAVASITNYLRDGGSVSDIAWLLALSLVLAAAIGFLGGVVASVYLSWPHPAPGTRHTLRRLPVATSGASTPASLSAWRWMLAAGLGAALLVLFVGSSGTLSAEIDEPVAEWFGRRDELGGLRHLDPLGRTEVAFVLAALVGVAALRCRVLALAYPLAVVAGGLASLVLKEVIDRPRPETSSLVGDIDSFPSGHMIQAVLIAGLLPLGLAVITGRRRLLALATVVLGLCALGAGVHRIQSGEHWPLDAVAGALVGLTLVLGAHWAVGHRAWHRRCRTCLWSDDRCAEGA